MTVPSEMDLHKLFSRSPTIFVLLFTFISTIVSQHEPAVTAEISHNNSSTVENMTESLIPVVASGALRDMTFTSAKAKTGNTAENATVNFNKGNRIESYSSGVPNVAPTNASSPLTAQDKLKSADLHQAKISEINAASLRPLLAPVQQDSPHSDVSGESIAGSLSMHDLAPPISTDGKNASALNVKEHTNITTLINS